VLIHNENTHKKPRINRQNRLKITFPGSVYPKEISQQYTPATHRSSALAEGPLGDLPSLSLTTEGSWIHLGGGSPNLSSARWRQYWQYPLDTVIWQVMCKGRADVIQQHHHTLPRSLVLFRNRG